MKKNAPTKLFVSCCAVLSGFMLPLVAAAASNGIAFTWQSPISGITTIEDLIVAVLTVAVTIAVPIIVLFIIYAGFLYVTAQGNAEQIKQATRALTYAIIGGVLIIGAVAISAVVGNVVTSFTS